jgi:hypothetical protein
LTPNRGLFYASNSYAIEQLRQEVERVRRKPLPVRTLQHWLAHLPISRDDNGNFNRQDAEIVKDLCRWLKKKPGHNTIQDFVNNLKEELQNAD